MNHRVLPSLMTCLVAVGSSIASAQPRPALPVLEEILVTAQKREQSLMDVPVSVIAVGGDKIDDSSIASLEAMGDYIPSFNITQTGLGTTIAIRGISSGVNQGFEQSAAQFVDGVQDRKSTRLN